MKPYEKRFMLNLHCHQYDNGQVGVVFSVTRNTHEDGVPVSRITDEFRTDEIDGLRAVRAALGIEWSNWQFLNGLWSDQPVLNEGG